MTERMGGSDVAWGTETVAVPIVDVGGAYASAGDWGKCCDIYFIH